MLWKWGSKAKTGWAVVDAAQDGFAFVHGSFEGAARPRVERVALLPRDGGEVDLAHAVRELGLGKYRCATLLGPDDYHMLLVEAPRVPRPEWKTAARWLVKEMVDFDVEQAALEILDIPAPANGRGRPHQIFAVAARKDVLAERINRYTEAAVPLAVIDVPETAQRNLSALHDESGRATGLAHFDDHGGLFTITSGGELYMSRRIEIGMRELIEGTEHSRAEARDRVLLELQRSLDHFERQFNELPLARVVIGPEPKESGLVKHLASNLSLPVAPIDLARVVDLPAGGIEPALQWRLFHLIGAAFRRESALH